MVRHTKTALPYQVVERLKDNIGEPLREVRSDEDAVFNYSPNEVEDAVVFDQLLHSVKHDLRLKAVVKMVDVQFCTVLRAFRVITHPLFDGGQAVVDASASNRATAPSIHTTHHHRLKHLHEGVMDVLVGPDARLVDISPLPGTLVPSAFQCSRRRLEALLDDVPKVDNSLRNVAVHPYDHLVRPVVRSPTVGAVYLKNRHFKVLVRDKFCV